MKTKVSVIVLTFILLMSVFSMDVLASSTNEANVASSTLSSYLLATQKGDINQMIALSNDSRVDPASIVKFYNEMLNKQSEQLVSNKILTQEVLSPTSYKFITELEFKNGDLSQVPFTLSKEKGHWKVIVTPNSLEDSKYKVIRGENLISGKSRTISTVPVNNPHKLVSSASLTSLCSWSFSKLFNTMYSTSTFSINSTYNQALVQGSQTSTDPRSGYSPDIDYAIVQPHSYGDTVWGDTINYGSGSYSFLINGTSKTFSNAKMRLTRVNGGSYDKANGDGKVYNN